jgi:hypothetical protein
MHTSSANIKVARTYWTLAHLWAAIRRLLIAKMGAEAAAIAPHQTCSPDLLVDHLLWPPAGAHSRQAIFRVNVREIARRTGVPTSPQLVIEMSSALDMLRRHAVVFGCDESRRPIVRPRRFRNVLER